MNFNHIKIIKLALSFLIPLIALLYLIPTFFNLELNDSSTPLLLLGALFLMLIINIYRKIGHQGQLPIWIGLALIGLSGIAILSSIGINGMPKLIELDARSQGFSMIGFGIGFFIFIIGLKQMIHAGYFLGSIKRK